MVPSGTGAEPPAQDGESVEGSQIETTDARTAPDESASTKESPGFNSGVQNVLTDEMTERFMRIMTSHAAKRNAAKGILPKISQLLNTVLNTLEKEQKGKDTQMLACSDESTICQHFSQQSVSKRWFLVDGSVW
jgi:hypothetical protein